MHRLHHVVNGGIEELLRGFGVEVPDQLRRVLDVGKQDRHLFAFAFQGSCGTSGSFPRDRPVCRPAGPGPGHARVGRRVALPWPTRPDQDAAFLVHRQLLA